MNNLLHDMALFVQVGKTLSFQRAAKQLGLSASTLSRRIALLEKQIGLRLFNRTTRQVEFTTEGQAYFVRCEQVLLDAQSAHQDLQAHSQQMRGTMRFSCTSDFAHFFLPPLLAEFSYHYPELRIEMELSARRIDLVAENVDFSLRMGGLTDSGLIAKTIALHQTALYASPAYLAKYGVPQSPSELSEHRLLAMKSNAGESKWKLVHTQQGEEHTVAFKAPIVVASPLMLRELVKENQGICLVDPIFATQDLERGAIQPVLPAWQGAPVALTMLTTSRLLPARVRVFGEFLQSRLRGGLGGLNPYTKAETSKPPKAHSTPAI